MQYNSDIFKHIQDDKNHATLTNKATDNNTKKPKPDIAIQRIGLVEQ